MTTVDIAKKLDSFNNLIQEFGNTTFTSKEIWNRQKEIAENFKAAQFNTPEDKTIAINRFEELISLLNQKENQVETANEQFSIDGEKMVIQLEEAFNKILAQESINKDDFKELRNIANNTFDFFKQQRWISKERRTIAWDKYNSIRNIIKDKEDDLFAKEREGKAKQISQSLEITEKLCVVINACHPSVAINDLLNYVNRFHQFLQDANLVESNAVWHLMEKPEDIKYSLRCRTETLNDIRNFIVAYKDAITREHKGQIFANIDALKMDINKAWETHKEDQTKRQEEWEIKKKERDEKRIEWNKKQQDFLKMLEGRLENQIAYKTKQEGYLLNQNEFAKRFEDRIPQQQEYIEKLHEQVIDLEKKYATAWTDSFKTKVDEWIKEKHTKIKTVEKDIETLKEKIIDINKKAEELPAKIKEINDSIEEIKSKIEEVKTKLANDVILVEPNNEKPLQTETAPIYATENSVTDDANLAEV